MLRELAMLFDVHSALFRDGCEVHGFYGIYRGQHAAQGSIDLVSATLSQLDLSARWRPYLVVEDSHWEPFGNTSVVITYQPDATPWVYLNTYLVNKGLDYN